MRLGTARVMLAVLVAEPAHHRARQHGRSTSRCRRSSRVSRLLARRCSGSSTPTCSSSPACCSRWARSATGSGASARCSPASSSFGVASLRGRVRPVRRPADRAARRHGRRRRDDHAGDAVGDHGRLPARGARARRSASGRRAPASASASGRSSAGCCSSGSRGARSSGSTCRSSLSRSSPGFALVPESRDPQPGRVRPARRRPVDRYARHARLRDHRGDAARLDGPAHARLLRAPRPCSAPRSPRGSAAPPRRCCRSSFFAQPALHGRLGRRRARRLRVDGLGLRVHAVPAVRARLQRARRGRRDDAARARPPHRRRPLEPASPSASAATHVIAGGLFGVGPVLSTSLFWSSHISPVLVCLVTFGLALSIGIAMAPATARSSAPCPRPRPASDRP